MLEERRSDDRKLLCQSLLEVVEGLAKAFAPPLEINPKGGKLDWAIAVLQRPSP